MKNIAKLSLALLCAMAVNSWTVARDKASSAQRLAPIHGAFATTFQTLTPPPFLEVSVTGGGITSHLGKSSMTIHQVVDFTRPGAPITGVVIIRAANGDELRWEMNLTSTPPVNGGVTFEGPITVVSGTGRFENATGTAWLIGSAQFTEPNSGLGELFFEGEISY